MVMVRSYQWKRSQSPGIVPCLPPLLRGPPGPPRSSRPDVNTRCLSTSWGKGIVSRRRSARRRDDGLTSFRMLADFVKEDRKAVSWTSSYSCGGEDEHGMIMETGEWTYCLEFLAEVFVFGCGKGRDQGGQGTKGGLVFDRLTC